MNINRLEKIKPYLDIIDGPISSGREKKEITKKEERELKKIEKKEKELEENIPKRNDIKKEIRQAVKDIKICNEYLTNQLIKKEYTNVLSTTANYTTAKNKALFNFFGTFLGAIDAMLITTDSSITYEKNFNRNSTKLNIKKRDLLTFRNEVVEGCKKEIDEKQNKKSTYKLLLEAIETHPSYMLFTALYEKIKMGDTITTVDSVIDFISAYNKGYQTGTSLTIQELKEEYIYGTSQVMQDKIKNEETYSKTIARIRK